jgi:hypothetical protein
MGVAMMVIVEVLGVEETRRVMRVGENLKARA